MRGSEQWYQNGWSRKVKIQNTKVHKFGDSTESLSQVKKTKWGNISETKYREVQAIGR